MDTKHNWTRTDRELPREGSKVVWISPGGIEEHGTYIGGAVWMPDGSDVYVYYTPEFWRYAQ